MDCSCHEPAVFGHLECDLAPRGHMTEHAAAAQRAEIRQWELARINELLTAERKYLKPGVGDALHSLRIKLGGYRQ